MLGQWLNGLLSVKTETPVIKSRSCIKKRNKAFQCNFCIDICPQKALNIRNDGIQINESKCEGCFLCVAACPVDALSWEWDRLGMLSLINRIPGENVVFGCNEKQEKINAHVPCILCLTPELLVSFVFLFPDKHFFLFDQDCYFCKDSAPSIINGVLQNAKESLKNANDKEKIGIFPHEGDGLQIYAPVYSRRQFLAFLKKIRTSDNFSTSILDELNDVFWNSSILPDRRILFHIIRKTNKANDLNINANVAFDWHVNDNCNLCNICSSVCPFSAWEKQYERDEIILQYKMDLCTGCGLCTFSCPRQSISALFDGAIKTGKAKIKFSQKQKVCVQCGKIMPFDHPELCSICEKHKTIIGDFF